MLRISRDLTIDENEIEISFVRASGPGGQNVNKLSTAAQLRFDTRRIALAGDAAARLAGLAGQRMTKDGVIVIHAQRFRTQERNRTDAIDPADPAAANQADRRIETAPAGRQKAPQRHQGQAWLGAVRRLRGLRESAIPRPPGRPFGPWVMAITSIPDRPARGLGRFCSAVK